MGHLSGVSGSKIENFVWMVKHLMKRQNILHDEKGFILCQSLNANQLGGPGVCSPGKISNLEVLKLPESCNFQSIFAYSEFSRRATILHEKRHFARAFQKGGGSTYSLCPPVPTSIIEALIYPSQLQPWNSTWLNRFPIPRQKQYVRFYIPQFP